MMTNEELQPLKSTPKVLVVDDKQAEREILTKLLSKLELDVMAVGSGQAALQQLIRDDYTLILLDIQMPIMDGIETARYIRTNPMTENIPIIFLTAYDKDDLNMLQGYEIGAIDYIIKPINEDILLSKVKTFIRSNIFEKEKEYEKILSELRSKNEKLEQAKQEALLRLKEANIAKVEAQNAQQRLTEQTNELLRYTHNLEQFAYVATHDLRAPIINLEGIVNIFRKRGYVNDENADIFQRIELSVARVKSTLHDLIGVVTNKDYSPDEVTSVNFDEVYQDVIDDLDIQIKDAEAKVSFIRESAPSINYVPRFLRSILQNLLTNALKYRSSERPLEIGVMLQDIGDHFRLVVKDNGVGIDESKKDKVFGLFQRLSKDVGGKGIGLYITKSQIEKCGGSIDFYSAPEGGTTFIIDLQNIKER